MSEPTYWLLAWLMIASIVINIDRWRLRKLERENKKLWDIVQRMMSPTPTTASRRGRIYVATKEIKDSDNG